MPRLEKHVYIYFAASIRGRLRIHGVSLVNFTLYLVQSLYRLCAVKDGKKRFDTSLRHVLKNCAMFAKPHPCFLWSIAVPCAVYVLHKRPKIAYFVVISSARKRSKIIYEFMKLICFSYIMF